MLGFFKKAPPAAAEPALDPDQIQPRIKHLNFIGALRSNGVPAEQMPSVTPLCGELIVTYAFDLPDRFIMATPALLEGTGVSSAQVPGRAIAYLQRQLPQPTMRVTDGCQLVHTGGDLEATLLLVDAFWDAMQADIRGHLLVTVPRRDRLLMCDGADRAAIEALQRQTEEYFHEHDDAHRLSTQIMARRNGAWALYDGGFRIPESSTCHPPPPP